MNAWLCIRCDRVSTDGDVDDPPEGWRIIYRPVRGSEGARSESRALICWDCDDSLYEWWQS